MSKALIKPGSLRRLYLLAALFSSLFQRSSNIEEIAGSFAEVDDEATDFSRIRCPLCRWQPRGSDRWYCADCAAPEYFFAACGACWNTFATRGLCPGCGHQWLWTSCLNCAGWSLHEDWYAPGAE